MSSGERSGIWESGMTTRVKVDDTMSELPARTVCIGLAGGLGNQLFAMAAAFGYGRLTDRTAVIDVRQTFSTCLPLHTSDRYLDSVFKNFPRTARLPAGIATYREALHDSLRGGSKIPRFEYASHVKLHGYFLGEHQIKSCIAEFVQQLCLPAVAPVPNTVFMHVRRGDVVKNIVYRTLYMYNLDEYCRRAMALVRARLPGVRIRVFSDDLNWCRAQRMFGAPDVEFEEERAPTLALMKMAACEAGGICWNSTFSWWAAYLNPNPAKLVTMPLQFNKLMPTDVWPSGTHIVTSGPALLANGVFALTCIVAGVIICVLLAVCIWLGVSNTRLRSAKL